jgi:hypothetical protein
MSEISPCVSSTSEDCDLSNTSTSITEDDISTPPQSPPAKQASNPSDWITYDPKTGVPKYNFPSLTKKEESKESNTNANAKDTANSSKENKPTSQFFTSLPPASNSEWITHDPQSGMIRYNFPSLNKRPKTPPSPPLKFDKTADDLPSPPPSPSKTSGNTYLANTSPYTRPGATLAVVGMRTGAPQKPPSPIGSSSSSSSSKPTRPQVSMPKSQPLSRMLFSKLSDNNTLGGPVPVRKSSKPQKLIVPTKNYQTVFELPLTSSEFARRR